MQKARRRPKASTACRHTVSGSFSLPYSGFFSPFPHGTSSLSVSEEYLALPDGSGRFRQDFTCPALLRIPLSLKVISCTGLSPSMVKNSKLFHYNFIKISWSYNPSTAETVLVWAISTSLAATTEITIVFFSCAYLDVSVQRVCPLTGDMSSTYQVSPFRNLRITRYLLLPVTYRSLSRLSSPLRA
jgi:hypothetical protein